MRYIDRTNCKAMSDRGISTEITKMGKLTKAATQIAENEGLGLLKTHFGTYRVIRACGLGAYRCDLQTLAEVDEFLKNMDAHKADRI